jgi:hypothetical protein
MKRSILCRCYSGTMSTAPSPAPITPDATPSAPPSPNSLLELAAIAQCAPYVHASIELDLPDLVADGARSVDGLASARADS